MSARTSHPGEKSGLCSERAFFRGLNVEVVRQLLGHSSVSSTSAYLNIGQKEALEIARKVEF